MQLSATFSLLTLIAYSSAGFITCINGEIPGAGDENGTEDIPAHNAVFSLDGSNRCFGPAVADNCGQMPGGPVDPTASFQCDSGSADAQFWITSDLCLNIETGGQHFFCCPGSIDQDEDGGETTCNI